MLMATVLDPDLFSPANLADDGTRVALIRHLDSMCRNNVVVFDDASADGTRSLIWKELRAALPSLPMAVQQRLGLLVQSPRKAFVAGGAVSTVNGLQVVNPAVSAGSWAAVALAEHPRVDVVMASGRTYRALGGTNSKIATNITFVDSPAYNKEQSYLRPKLLGTLTKAQFVEQVVDPVVYWARSVRIIDPHVCSCAIRKGSNLFRFKDTITAIHHAWRNGYYGGTGAFEVISTATDPWDPQAAGLSADQQAQSLASELELNDEHATIRLKTAKAGLRIINHDRFLVTNQEVVLGFTRGFDVTGGDGHCVPCEVYTRTRREAGDTIDELLATKDVGLFKYPRGSACVGKPKIASGSGFQVSPFASLG